LSAVGELDTDASVLELSELDQHVFLWMFNLLLVAVLLLPVLVLLLLWFLERLLVPGLKRCTAQCSGVQCSCHQEETLTFSDMAGVLWL
jgi:hypothetical protein